MISLAGVILCILLLAAGTPGAASPAVAPPGREVSVIAVAGGAELRVRGRPVIRLPGRGAVARLREAAARLEPLLPPPTEVSVRSAGTGARLVVDGRVVLAVTRADLGRLGLPRPTVEQWAAALRAAIETPPIALSRRDLVLSPGYGETIAVVPAWAAPVTLGAYDETVITVTLQGERATVTGRAVGRAIVPFRMGPYRVQLPVSVRPPAGRVPAEAEVVVTGSPAPPDLVREAIDRRLQDVVERDPGSVMVVGRAVLDGPVPPGQSITVLVPVTLRSPHAGPAGGTVAVRVTNAPVALADPDLLLISNRPEKITDNGLLFQESLEPGRPARLLYHHLNGTPGQSRVLKITLHNPERTRARVHYLSGHAGPSGDPIYIGYASTQRFLDALIAGRGYVVDVPAGGGITFTAHTLPALALVSGLMQFQVLDGGPVGLVVHVRTPWLLDHTVTADLGPYAFPHPRGTFSGSVIEIDRELAAHEAAPVADLGVMSNLRDVRTGEALAGDYGVLYRVRLRLVNPTDRDVGAALVAQAAGGLARGLFYVNGTPVDVGLMRAYDEKVVTEVSVPPGGAREMLIVTMPVAGSYYPVRLGLRPR
jgi:hypothetical protein